MQQLRPIGGQWVRDIHLLIYKDLYMLSPARIDVNRKDYRAWYGLGQAYELLNMHQYALHYYQHATALR